MTSLKFLSEFMPTTYDLSKFILENKDEILNDIHKFHNNNPLAKEAYIEYEDACLEMLRIYLWDNTDFDFNVVDDLTKEGVRQLLGAKWNAL